jgi:acrylyl-CoA reductase (NADPH)
MDRFPAVVVTEPGPASLVELSDADLPPEPVTVEVTYSSLNYKDGLAVTGSGKVVREFPMVCGIDLAGRVVASEVPSSSVGDEVLVTGFGLGETHPGGYSGRQRLRPEWLVRVPAELGARRAMAIGTAGLTAMLCVMVLEHDGLAPSTGAEVLVTGAAGGVGSVAVALLSRLGYRVVASTGRPELEEYLRHLGAVELIGRAELAAGAARPLARERWAGVVDSVGSSTLAAAISQTVYGGTVAACGLAGGNDLATTVLPFILRGVKLAGVDSVQCPLDRRAVAWRRLAGLLPGDLIDELSEVRPMSEIVALAGQVLAGEVRGRVVINPGA